MGNVYKFRCSQCGFEREYHDGGGFFSNDYYAESDKLSSEFKIKIQSGGYGALLQAVSLADKNNELIYDCDTHLYQCLHCFTLVVCRGKRVYRNGIYNMKPQFDSNYSLTAEIEQYCPECLKGVLKRVDVYHAWCPKCKNGPLTLVSRGFWD